MKGEIYENFIKNACGVGMCVSGGGGGKSGVSDMHNCNWGGCWCCRIVGGAGSPVWIWNVFYVDPILFGAIVGMIVFILVEKLYEWMKAKNGGHAHFPFERVVLPVVALALVSWLFCICM